MKTKHENETEVNGLQNCIEVKSTRADSQLTN